MHNDSIKASLEKAKTVYAQKIELAAGRVHAAVEFDASGRGDVSGFLTRLQLPGVIPDPRQVPLGTTTLTRPKP